MSLKDPYNIIITGVGGQGNVTASKILGTMLVPPYVVTIGETFGASQRGGSVMSHVRVSAKSVWSPQIPHKKADLLVALEPAEALRVMGVYSHANTHVIVNMRPVYPVGVSADELNYPPLDKIKEVIQKLTDNVWFLHATDTALQTLENPILGNMIILGAVAGLHILPITEKDFEKAVSKIFPEDKVAVNVKAFKIGIEMIRK